jgi:hypothetical protein
MELTLVEVTIKGVPATVEKVREYLRNKKIELPESLTREIIKDMQKQAIKKPCSLNRA